MPPFLVAAVASVAGLLLGVAGYLAIRRSGAQTTLGRRLAGAREYRVADLFDLDELPARPVRIVGRIRSPDPIRTARDDRLVALHRDVTLRLDSGAWRTIERLRVTRGMELWDHGGSLPVDMADAAEPLISIPHVWEGDPTELDYSYRAAIERVAASGVPVAARSVSRMVSVVDRLLLLALVRRNTAGQLRLEPPPGGFVVSTVELDAAMRLLGGPRRRLLLAGAAIMLVGAMLVAGAVIGAVVALAIG